MDNWPFEDARVLSFDLLRVDTGRVSNASPSSTNLLPPPRRTTVAIALSRFFDGLTNYGSRYRYFRCRAFDILLFRSGTSGRATFKERYKAATASFYRSLGFDRIYLPSRLVVFYLLILFSLLVTILCPCLLLFLASMSPGLTLLLLRFLRTDLPFLGSFTFQHLRPSRPS